jgi:hypothetical protein
MMGDSGVLLSILRLGPQPLLRPRAHSVPLTLGLCLECLLEVLCVNTSLRLRAQFIFSSAKYDLDDPSVLLRMDERIWPRIFPIN